MHRMKVENWGVTFPKHNTNKETFADQFPPSKYSLVCEELHEDGTPHLHAALRLTKGLTHAGLIKWLKAKFPDDWKRIKIEGIKNWEHWHNYCQKEDPDTIIKGSLDNVSARQEKLTRIRNQFRAFVGEQRFEKAEQELLKDQEIQQNKENHELWMKGKW